MNICWALQSGSGPENNETHMLFNELIHFHVINIPPPPKGSWSILSCHTVVSFLLALASALVTSTVCGPRLFSLSCLATWPVLSSNDQLTVPFLPSGASVLCTIVLWGHTAVPFTVLQDTRQQLWEASHPGPFTRKAWKDFLEHQFRGPTTSQTIRDYSKARIHFPLLLPHRYPWEKTNLQKNSPCQLTSPARCMMTLNSCLWVLTLIVNAQEFWKAILKISPSPPHTSQPPGLGYAFFPFYSFSHVCWNWHFLFSVHSLLGINAGSSGEACTIFPVLALGEPRDDGLNVPGSTSRITI